MGKLTLKKVKVYEAMSEETICFSADLYEDGKLVAHVSNRGQGGSNEIDPAKGLRYEDVAHIDNLDTECEILGLAEEYNIVKKNQAKAFVLKKGDNTFLQKNSKSFAQLKKYGNYTTWLEDQKLQITAKGYEILNTNM